MLIQNNFSCCWNIFWIIKLFRFIPHRTLNMFYFRIIFITLNWVFSNYESRLCRQSAWYREIRSIIHWLIKNSLKFSKFENHMPYSYDHSLLFEMKSLENKKMIVSCLSLFSTDHYNHCWRSFFFFFYMGFYLKTHSK